MAKLKTKTAAPKKKPIEQYEQKGKQPVNNLPVELVTTDTDPDVESGQPEEDLLLHPSMLIIRW